MNKVFHTRKQSLVRYPATPTLGSYTANIWMDLYNTGALKYDGKLVSFSLKHSEGVTSTPLNPTHRVQILRRGEPITKVLYPFSSSLGSITEIEGSYTLYPTIKLSYGDTLIVQVNCTDDAGGNATVTLNYLEILEEN